MIIQDYEYHYSLPSVVKQEGNGKSFLLSHCSELEEDKNIQTYFYGQLKSSFIAAKCFSTLAKTVASNFSIIPGQMVYLRDPIVSAGSNRLLFEAFSSCNSVYARVEISPEGIDGDFLASGCTNVDFNDSTIRAFNSLTPLEKLILGVGRKELQINVGDSAVVEKKVSLPIRWIQGLGNVQLYLSQMDLLFSVGQIQAIQLFHSLPKTPIKEDYFLIQHGERVLASATSKGKSLRVGGVHRLRLIEPLLPFIKKISFYNAPEEQSVALILHLGDVQMLFVFSANVHRGFSGEGRNLENMTTVISDDLIIGASNLFKTNEIFNTTTLAIETDINLIKMDQLKASLSSIGLLGFNLETKDHFYRRLPFKIQRLKSLNPRLQNAKKLIGKKDVQIIRSTNRIIEAAVRGSSEVTHTVIIANGEPKCTCTWFINHQTKRGLCKHILAVKITVEEI